jgi:hypothetical protein
MQMTNPHFEEMRKTAFESYARKTLEQRDPATGLIRSVKLKNKDSMHYSAVGFDVRAMAEAACAWAVTGRDEQAWQALRFVLECQDRDPDSLTWGNFKWHSEWPLALDPNAVAFITPYLWYLYKHAGDRLPDDLRTRLLDAFRLALEGIQGHCCTFLYTNIVMLNLASRLCIADALNSPRARLLAGWSFEEWRNRIGALGVLPEYNSLTYTPVDIHALAIMLACPAQPGLHEELRALMRFFIAQAVADYHPGIGRITGPQSRAYEADRRLRGRSGMDIILSFLLPADECHFRNPFLWLGVPIGPEDILPEARNLPLPRQTGATGSGHRRCNYLGREFALGAVSGRGHWTGHSLPFFLAFKSDSERCGLPILPHAANKVEAHAADLHQGSLLAACSWLINGCEQPVPPSRNFSGLKTGGADNLLGSDFRPGFTLELGQKSDPLQLMDVAGIEILGPSVLGDVIVVTTPFVHVGFRFFSTAPCEIRMETNAEGERLLVVNGSRNGLVLNDNETAVLCGFLLEVVPVGDCRAAELAASLQTATVVLCASAHGWKMTLNSRDGHPLTMDLDARPATICEFPGYSMTANRWALSLAGK